MPDPSIFRDMDKAAERLADAVEAGEPVTIFGDYDVDGATSAALLIRLLRELGLDPQAYIPDRLMEGYGPSGEALVRIAARRGAADRHRRLRRAGVRGAGDGAGGRRRRDRRRSPQMRAPRCPRRFALVNPNRLDESDEGAAHGHLAAVGVAFLLGAALLRTLRGARLLRRAAPSRT